MVVKVGRTSKEGAAVLRTTSILGTTIARIAGRHLPDGEKSLRFSMHSLDCQRARINSVAQNHQWNDGWTWKECTIEINDVLALCAIQRTDYVFNTTGACTRPP